MAVLGKTTMPEFAVESMKLAYSGNRSKGYSENMGNIPMLALLYVAHYGCDQMSYTCPLPLRKIQGALDQIVQFVRDNCEKKETTAIATQMFIDLFTEERGSRKALMEGSEFQRHFAPYSTNPYLSRPSKTEIQASLFSGRFGTETGIDDTKRIERMIREEQVLEGIYGASAVTFNICETADAYCALQGQNPRDGSIGLRSGSPVRFALSVGADVLPCERRELAVERC